MTLATYSPLLGTSYIFSLLFINYKFSRAWHQLHVFPHLALVTCFPALDTGYMFSRVWHRLHPCFPALEIGYAFTRACHRLDVSLHLAPVSFFPALVAGCTFLLRITTTLTLYLYFIDRPSVNAFGFNFTTVYTSWTFLPLAVCYTCHFTGVGTGSMIRKHNTVHQMSKLRCGYCGQQSHISRM